MGPFEGPPKKKEPIELTTPLLDSGGLPVSGLPLRPDAGESEGGTNDCGLLRGLETGAEVLVAGGESMMVSLAAKLVPLEVRDRPEENAERYVGPGVEGGIEVGEVGGVDDWPGEVGAEEAPREERSKYPSANLVIFIFNHVVMRIGSTLGKVKSMNSDSPA